MKKIQKLLAFILVLMLALTASAETITLPDSTRIIETEAFAGDTSIGKVIVPEGATAIRSRAFADSSLTEIELPSTLTEISDDIFEGCENVFVTAHKGSDAYAWALKNGYIKPTEGALPESAHPYESNTREEWTYIHPTKAVALLVTFSEDTEIEEGYDFVYVTDAKGVRKEYSGTTLAGTTLRLMGNFFTLLFTSDGSEERYGFKITGIEAVATEEDLEKLGDFVTRDLPDGSLSIIGYQGSDTDLVIPAQINGKPVTAIHETAFQRSNITSVVISEGVQEIGERAFAYCENLKSAVIPDTAQLLGDGIFYRCRALETANLPEGLNAVPPYMFYTCSALKEITIPSTVYNIYYGAFYNCVSLEEITIPASVTYIETRALNANGEEDVLPAGKLAKITVERGNPRYEEFAGMLADKKEKAIIAYAYGSENETVVIPTDIERIGDEAFSFSGSLKYVTVPSNVTEVGDDAFKNCSALETAVFSEGVETLGSGVFTDCSALKTVTLPKSLQYMGENIFAKKHGDDGYKYYMNITAPRGSYAENWCIMHAVPVNGDMEMITDGDFEYAKYGSKLILARYNGEEYNVVIPAKVGDIPVTAIGSMAFADNGEVGSVVIPEGVEDIGSGAFYYCYNLRNVTLPASLKTIGEDAFFFCDALSGIELPEGLESIGKNAFYCNSMLEEITIPASVTEIGEYAFEECYFIEKVVFEGGNADIPAYMFQDCWSLESVTLAEGIRSIGEYAFGYCSALKEINIPSSVAHIDIGAFGYCELLESVTLQEGVESIGEYAFEGCYSLKAIYIPESVTSIGYGAFYECEGIIIYGEAGSEAETFANDMGYTFIAGKIPA